MWNTLKTISNPGQALNNMIQSNPQLKEAMEMSNGDPQKAFYSLAEKKGINPEDILNLLK